MAIARGHVVRLAGNVDLLGLHAMAPRRYPYLLESCAGANGNGRFDILFGFPGPALALAADGKLRGAARAQAGHDFLRAFDEWWANESMAPASDALPFHGGWFVFMAYELAGQIEPGPGLVADQRFPVALAVRIPAAIVRDRRSGDLWAVAEPGEQGRLDEISDDVARQAASRGGEPAPPAAILGPGGIREDDPQVFLDAVRRVQDYIARGDIYQANISRRWQGQLARGVQGWMVYQRLRQANPAPFAGLASFDGAWIASSSPERLVQVRGRRVQTRPIAGTRPRTGPGDEAGRSELVANPKERSEHVMLIDLERNDLGRVCTAGSVQVDDFMTVESYAHVHHIVSGVSGWLRRDATPGAVLRAVFPGGTITGCPKVRCMQIIRELEARPRGPYTGSMGYVNRDGSCDFNILIRTIVGDAASWRLDAGSGIVAESDPVRELEETRAKAKGMLLSLEG